jgi:K+-transporting ATPase ATPase C chain
MAVKKELKELLSAFLAVLTFIVILGVLYPLLVTGVGQVAFSGNANGQKVYLHGKLVGSKIIGQNFSDPVYRNGKEETSDGSPVTVPDRRYFQSRPSGDDYNAASTAFANYGPDSIVTEKAIASNVATYIALNGKYYPGGLSAAKVPVDAADTSASGIDPGISQANAWIQAYRIAAVRHLTLAKVDALIAQYTAGRGLGFSGEPSVNVLELNLALDRL